jgi:Apea-like HEPN
MRILRWEDVPESRTKARLSSRNGKIRPYYPTDEIVPHRAGAELAIEISLPVGLQLLSSSGPPPQSGGAYLAYFESERLDSERAEDVVRCLFLMSQKPVGIIAEWPIAADPAANRHFGGHLTYGRALFDLSFALPNDGQLDGDKLITLWQGYSDLKANDRDTIRYAIDRMNLAKRRPTVVDSAIDLGIALEMLLLHNSDSKTELRFRLSLYGAAFIGGTHDVRKSNFKLLQKIYDLRSSAVHRGRLSKNHVELAPALIEKGINLAVAITRKLISLGQFPDYESEYLFGANDIDGPPRGSG